jgi:hypothetical protein
MHRIKARAARLTLLIVLVFLCTASLQTVVFAQEELPPGDFRLVIKEAFILEQMETQFKPLLDNLSNYGIPLEDPVIDLQDNNRIAISATTEVPFLNRPVTVRPTLLVALAVEDNRMTFDIERIDLEGISLPAALIAPQIEGIQQQLETQINMALQQFSRLIGLELVSIGTTEDLLILDFDFNYEFYRFDQ